MEILQTIWTALTTENEMLTKIITSVVLMPLELFLSMLIFFTLLNIEATKKRKILYYIIFFIIAILALWVIPVPYNTFINVIACPILVIIIFKTNILKAILAEILPYIYFVIVGSILLGIISLLYKSMDAQHLVTIPIIKIVSSLILYLLAYILCEILKRNNISIKFIENIKLKKNFWILFINIFIGITALLMQSYTVSLYSQYIPIPTLIISIFILLSYFSISIYSLFRTKKLEVTTTQLAEEQLYNKTLNVLYDNIRGFKHDFQNIMQSLGGYISTNNMDGLRNYYKDLLPDSLKINQLDILNPDTINNPAVYSILTEKYHEADNFDINMNIEAFLDMQNINMKTYELTRILGILLDNAIDAAKKCDKKQINVTIRKDNKANRQLFIIENTYTNKDVDTDKIFEKGYTSKAKEDKASHGLGLWEVRKILKRNNNLNLFTTKTNDFFKQQLEIYY